MIEKVIPEVNINGSLIKWARGKSLDEVKEMLDSCIFKDKEVDIEKICHIPELDLLRSLIRLSFRIVYKMDVPKEIMEDEMELKVWITRYDNKEERAKMKYFADDHFLVPKDIEKFRKSIFMTLERIWQIEGIDKNLPEILKKLEKEVLSKIQLSTKYTNFADELDNKLTIKREIIFVEDIGYLPNLICYALIKTNEGYKLLEVNKQNESLIDGDEISYCYFLDDIYERMKLDFEVCDKKLSILEAIHTEKDNLLNAIIENNMISTKEITSNALLCNQIMNILMNKAYQIERIKANYYTKPYKLIMDEKQQKIKQLCDCV